MKAVIMLMGSAGGPGGIFEWSPVRYGTIAVRPNASLSGDCSRHRSRLDEFLPVSSSAHLEVVPWLFGWKDPGLTFDIALHAGTLAAVIIYFLRDWMQIIAQASGSGSAAIANWRRTPTCSGCSSLASIPVGIAGLSSTSGRNQLAQPYLIGAMLIAGRHLMWIADQERTAARAWAGQRHRCDRGRVGAGPRRRAGNLSQRHHHHGRAVPRFQRETAARFSFLLSTPAIAAAAAKNPGTCTNGGIPPGMGVPFALGIVVSGIVGAVVIAFFLRYLRGHQSDAFRLVPHHFWHNSNRSGCIFPLQRGMRLLGPTRFERLNEALAFVFLFAGCS